VYDSTAGDSGFLDMQVPARAEAAQSAFASVPNADQAKNASRYSGGELCGWQMGL